MIKQYIFSIFLFLLIVHNKTINVFVCLFVCLFLQVSYLMHLFKHSILFYSIDKLSYRHFSWFSFWICQSLQDHWQQIFIIPSEVCLRLPHNFVDQFILQYMHFLCIFLFVYSFYFIFASWIMLTKKGSHTNISIELVTTDLLNIFQVFFKTVAPYAG